MKNYFFVLLVLFTTFSIKSQEINTSNEGGAWFTLLNNFQISEKIFFQNTLQFRFVNFIEKTRVFLIQPSVNYKFGGSIIAGIGYNYSNYSQQGVVLPTLDYENRIWQHITLLSNFNKVKMNQRFMFEERFMVRNISETKSYSNRFRYRINFDFNILKFKNYKYLLGRISDELRIRFTSGINNPTFDQNNFLTLLGYNLQKNSKLYLGYGRNYYHIIGDLYWGDNIFNLIFNYNFNFTKK